MVTVEVVTAAAEEDSEAGAAGSEREQSGYGTLDAAGVANTPTSQLGTVVNGQEDLFGNNLGKQLTLNADSDGNRYHFGSNYEVAAQAGQAVASDTVPSDLTRDRLSDFSSYNLSSAVELPGIVASNENNLNQEVATIVSVPDQWDYFVGWDQTSARRTNRKRYTNPQQGPLPKSIVQQQRDRSGNQYFDDDRHTSVHHP